VTNFARTDERIREVHPEVTFRAMNNRWPLRETASAPLDDVLDAAAAAWSAQRIALGIAETLPGQPERVDGMTVCIWY
jgi:predicted RNase H-like nuclease